MPATPPSNPKRENSTCLNRDDRIRVLTLRGVGCSYQQISNQLGISHRQVQYTCQSQRATPRKAHGQPPKLSDDQVNDIIAWISASKINHRMPYHKIVQELDFGSIF